MYLLRYVLVIFNIKISMYLDANTRGELHGANIVTVLNVCLYYSNL